MIGQHKEYIDIIQEVSFREETFSFLKKGLGIESYSVPDTIPRLYKYRALSKYALEDILQEQFTATSIEEFNDVFDGAIHIYGDEKERVDLAQKNWEELEELGRKCGLPGLLPHDPFIQHMSSYYKQESRNKFHLPGFVGTYVFCLSERNNSTLMWAHYAAENTGICIEYNYNQIQRDNLRRQCLFPVVYSSMPIDVSPLIGRDAKPKEQYPYDTAILCVALNKSIEWEYEKEWRFVIIFTSIHEKRLPLQSISPERIIWGNRFLKPLFYYSENNEQELKDCEEHYDRIHRLLDYMIQQNIRTAIMIPNIGSYKLEPKSIDAGALKEFVESSFSQCKCKSARFYYTIYDQLLDLLEDGHGKKARMCIT